MHMCNLILEMVLVWIRRALRRSGVSFGAGLDARDKACRCCFSRFTAVLQEIPSSGSANADPVSVVCKRFARNGTLSNGNSGNPS